MGSIRRLKRKLRSVDMGEVKTVDYGMMLAELSLAVVDLQKKLAAVDGHVNSLGQVLNQLGQAMQNKVEAMDASIKALQAPVATPTAPSECTEGKCCTEPPCIKEGTPPPAETPQEPAVAA